MNDRERDLSIEGAVTAYRARDADGRIVPSADWCDLSAADREALFEAQIRSRLLERAADAEGLSSTTRAVLERLRG